MDLAYYMPSLGGEDGGDGGGFFCGRWETLHSANPR